MTVQWTISIFFDLPKFAISHAIATIVPKLVNSVWTQNFVRYSKVKCLPHQIFNASWIFLQKRSERSSSPIFCQKDSKLTTFIRKYVNICNQSHLIKCRSSGAQSLSRIIFASFPPLVSRGPPIMQCNALPCTSRLATHNVYSSKALTEISQTKRDQQTAIKWSFKIKTSPDIFLHLFFMFIGWKFDNQVALFPLITKSHRLIVIPLLAPPGWSSTRMPCDALLIKRDVSKYRMQQICIIGKEGFLKRATHNW